MAQPREAADDLRQHQRRTVAVLDVGGVDHGVDQIALGVGQDMALAALDLLARIIAARTAGFRGFDALAVDHPGTGRGFAPGRLAPDQEQGMIERQPQPVVPPQVEPAPHCRDRRKARRQHPPRQTAAQQIQDRLDNPPQRPLAWSPTCEGGGKNGSSSAHSASVKSLGKAKSAYCAGPHDCAPSGVKSTSLISGLRRRQVWMPVAKPGPLS
jgi:hypothetical protein